jgi:hypothetical protein
MGQHFSTVNSQFFDFGKLDDTTFTIATTLSDPGNEEDVNLFLSRNILSATTNNPALNIERKLINRIQHDLSRLADVCGLKVIDAKVSETFGENILPSIITDYDGVMKEINLNILEKRQQLRASFTSKLRAKTKVDSDAHNDTTRLRRQEIASNEQQSSLSSRRSTVLQSAARNVSTSAHHLQSETASSTNIQFSERSILNILSKVPEGVVSLKDILRVLQELIFDTVHVYDVQNIFKKLNTNFEGVRQAWKRIKQSEPIASEHDALESSTGKTRLFPEQKELRDFLLLQRKSFRIHWTI